jgi:cobalamin biosynthesis Co2+ chelatase CbiK
MLVTKPETIHALTQALSDEYSMKIILSTIPKEKSVEDLSKENDIPLSTCYRRVHEMLDGGLLIVQRIVVTPDGKKYELLRSAFNGFSIKFEGGGMIVEAKVNEDIADKLHRMWVSMKP